MNLTTEIWHYGIKGQKRGLRRFQNEDGTYTEEGKERYGIGDGREGIVSRQPKDKLHISTKSGPYDSFKYKDPNERMRENAKKLKSAIDKKHRNEIKELISNGQNDISDADKKKLKSDLKTGYKNRMGGALSTAVAGWGLKNIGALVSVGLGHRVTGRIMQVAGHLMVGGALFSAAANTGAYFIGKNMVNQGKIRPEDIRGGKK